MQATINLLPKQTKYIPGYEYLYSVSKKGDVYSKHSGVWAALKPCRDSSGYLQLGLVNVFSQRRMWKVHQLVAKTYIPNVHNKNLVDHKNNIKHDNRVENLQWFTPHENILKKYNEDGHRHHKSKAVIKVDRDGKETEYWSAMEAKRKTGIDSSAIMKTCKGLFKQSGGYKWKYVTSNY